METHLPPRWKERVLWGLNAVPCPENLRFLEAMQRAEGGSAKWNPLNSTLRLAGFTDAKDYNSVAVRNYTTQIGGVAATVLTFAQRNTDGTLVYGGLVGNFQIAWQNGRTAEQMVANCRDEISIWGTDHDLILAVLKDI